MAVVLRNITPQFVRLRAEHRKKKNRFGYSILLGSSPGSGGGPHTASGLSGDATGDEAITPLVIGQQRLLSSTDGESHATTASTPPGSVEVEMSSRLPPIWVERVEEAQDGISKLKEKMSALQKAEQRRLLKVFSPSDSALGPGSDKDIDNLTQQITRLFHHCESCVHQIQGQDIANISPSEFTLRKNAQRSIATQLQQLSQQFRTQQKHFLSELRKRKNDSSYNVEGPAPVQDSKYDAGFGDRLAMELDTMDQDIDQRNEEIAKVAESVAELHNIFKDLSLLVIDQGTVLDRIDYNVEQVVTQTEQATVHIAKAESHQKSARAGTITGCLVISIIVLLILWILKHS